MTSPLHQAIQRYQRAIATLADKQDPQVVLEVLAARDAVQALIEDPANLSGADLKTINALDQQLRSYAGAIAPLCQAEQWCANFCPRESAWWWFLEAPKPRLWSQFDWLWMTVSVTCLTISLGLVTDISSRFLKGGPDAVGAIAVSTQSILTLLAAGGALTKAGHEAGRQVLRGLKVPDHYWQELGAAGSCLLMAGTVSLHQAMPAISQWYSERGWQDYQGKDWGSAETKLKRSLELNANNSQAHFRLGQLYESLQQTDAARTQYQYAGSELPAATNQLARLEILANNYPQASAILEQTLAQDSRASLSPEVEFSMLKNLGWSQLQQGNYAAAETSLNQAIQVGNTAKLQPSQTASAYCLKAQLTEAQNSAQSTLVAQQQALPAWQRCAQDSQVNRPEEAAWVTTAQQRLETLKQQP